MMGDKDQMFQLMKAFFEQNVPYAKHTGIELLVIADGHGVAKLPDRHETQNHMGSQHAGALFTLAEAASGAASVSLFADKVALIKAAITRADIKYLRSARGAVRAEGHLRIPASDVLATFTNDGRVDFTVDVTLTDSKDREVATMEVSWSIKSNMPNT